MKVFMEFLPFVILIAIQCVQAGDPKTKEASRACKRSTDVSDLDIFKLRNGEREKIQEYSLCYLKKTAAINEEGHFEIDTIKTLLKLHNSEEEVEEIVKKCAVEKDTSLEAMAYEALLCANREQKNLRKQ